MAPVTNGQLLYNSVPSGGLTGETTLYDGDSVIDLENVSLNGGFLVQTIAVSIDPFLPVRMVILQQTHLPRVGTYDFEAPTRDLSCEYLVLLCRQRALF